MSTSSFRHRLQRQANLHIQTHHLPPPPPQQQHQQPSSSSSDHTHPHSAFPTTAASPMRAGIGRTPILPRSSASLRVSSSATSSTSRPPLSPRGYSAAAATGQSRFVEGSMNDRVSAAPPRGFLGFDDWDGEDDDGPGQGRGRDGLGEGGMGMDLDYRLGGVASGNGGRYDGGGNGGKGGGDGGDEGARYELRRPRSTAAWVGLGAGGGGQQGQAQEQSGGGAVVVKKTSFLAPLWDGVKEKLSLSKSKSSGSIGRVVNSVVGGGGGGGREREREREVREREVRERERMAAAAPAPAPAPAAAAQSSTTGYPSREEVLESYKNLVASGFFEAHAIRGGRHPLRTGAAVPESNRRSFAEHMASPGTMPPPGRSPADHMTAPVTVPPPGRSFADHMAAHQQQKPALPFPPQRHSMGPPPPPRGSSQGKPDSFPSPQRGTKRGASLDLASDAEMVTRKLVKKLRHSASRISMELTGARDNYSSYGTLRSRPSTSHNPPAGPLSPTSSVFSSGITSPPRTAAAAPAADDTLSTRHGKLTKPKDGRRRRILGLTRRNRSPAPAAADADADTDPDAMMIDEPEESHQPKPSTIAAEQHGPRIHHRIITPPPPAFRTHYPQRLRTSSATSSLMSVQQHEPLSIVPDPNQGIPFVPRIPREFCDAMAAMVPAAVVVVGGGGVEKKEEGGEEGKGKTVNRDSGLGEDVENMPVWG